MADTVLMVRVADSGGGYEGLHWWREQSRALADMRANKLALIMPTVLAVNRAQYDACGQQPPHEPEKLWPHTRVLAYAGALDVDCETRPEYSQLRALWDRHVAGERVTLGDLFAIFPPLAEMHRRVHRLRALIGPDKVQCSFSGGRGYHCHIFDEQLWTLRLLADRPDAVHTINRVCVVYGTQLDAAGIALDKSAAKNDHGLRPLTREHPLTACWPWMCQDGCNPEAPCCNSDKPLFVDSASPMARDQAAAYATRVWARIYTLLPLARVPLVPDAYYRPRPPRERHDNDQYAFLRSFLKRSAGDVPRGPNKVLKHPAADMHVFEMHCAECGRQPEYVPSVGDMIGALVARARSLQPLPTGLVCTARASPVRAYLEIDKVDLRAHAPGASTTLLQCIASQFVAQVRASSGSNAPITLYVDVRRTNDSESIQSWHIVAPQVVCHCRLCAAVLASRVERALAGTGIALDLHAVSNGALSMANTVKGRKDGTCSRPREMYAILRDRPGDPDACAPPSIPVAPEDVCTIRDAYCGTCILHDCPLPTGIAAGDVIQLAAVDGVDHDLLQKNMAADAASAPKRIRTGTSGDAAIDDLCRMGHRTLAHAGIVPLAAPYGIAQRLSVSKLVAARYVPGVGCPFNGGCAHLHDHVSLQVNPELQMVRLACDDTVCVVRPTEARARAWHPLRPDVL